MSERSRTTVRQVSSLERAIVVLGVLAEAPGDLGTNEVARRSGLGPSTVSRLLATLAAHELVRWVPATGRYRLGLRLVELGNAALGRVDLRELTRPHLERLTAATGETATLSVPGEQAAITVDYVQSPASVRSVAELGRRSVLHATATGKVVLAFGGSPPTGPLTAYTPWTITDARRLADEIAAVRERGWARAVCEREDALNGLAMPVRDPSGALAAILGLQGPASRFDEERIRAAVPLLREHTERLWTDAG